MYRKKIDLAGEEWKPAFGYEGLYSVSNKGRVISDRKRHQNGLAFFMEQSPDGSGYLKIVPYKNGSPRCVKIHSMVAKTFIPNPRNLPQVNHKDGIKTNNHAENLEWVSQQDNLDHGWKTGLLKATFGNSKLTPNDVREIRRLKASGESVVNLAQRYKLTRTTIYDLLKNRTWTHL